MSGGTKHAASADRELVISLAAWFQTNARDLPWRKADTTKRNSSKTGASSGQRDPYKSLVSELMLQQTQVSRVLPKFVEFIRLFPTAAALAAASEERVLAAWTGLGYYRRAKLLHAAAKEIVERHAGEVPRTAMELSSLPGVGRYTAGAIASIVFGTPEPIVDGNVSRVLMRVRGKDLASDDPEAVRWSWSESARLVQIAGEEDARRKNPQSPGTVAKFNEGLMELGATVCTPDAPRCLYCPWRDCCVARAEGTQDRIPRPKSATKRRPIVYATAVVRDPNGRVLVERRPDGGLWAGLWQTPTLESSATTKAVPTAAAMGRWLGLAAKPVHTSVKKKEKSGGDRRATQYKATRGKIPHIAPLRRTDEFIFHTTHREIRFIVFEATVSDPTTLVSDRRTWCDQTELATLALSSPMRRILGLP